MSACLLQLGAPTQADAPGATTQSGLAHRSSPERRSPPPVRAHLEPTAVGVGRGGLARGGGGSVLAGAMRQALDERPEKGLGGFGEAWLEDTVLGWIVWV